MRAPRWRAWLLGAVLAAALLPAAQPAWSAPGVDIRLNPGTWGVQVNVENGGPRDLSGLLKIFLLLTVLALAPTLVILCTSFTRILIVLSFLRHALGVSNLPPNQVLIGIALFLTAFNMFPVWQQVQTRAVAPYQAGALSWQQAGERGIEPLRQFMLRQTRPKDLGLFVRLSRQAVRRAAETPLLVVVPAFILSELRTAFAIGFLLYLPFLVIDMVVASILLSMGMMMLPPVMISLPFKLLLFVMIDGWNLLVSSLLRSFH